MTMTDITLRQCPYDLPEANQTTRLSPLIEKHEVALLLLAGFAGFSLLVGLGYNAIRRLVFRDNNNLDMIFDAGGNVSLSLTAVTVTSQMLWPADFLQSPTNASKVGVGGTLWYSLAIILSVLAFPVLCIQLKTRAPGAKTFPQIAYARFGKVAHIVFCVVALFTNLVVTANLILAGKATIEVLTKDTSTEFIILVLAVLFGCYCMIGGLGTTFYISYFNTSLIFIASSFFILSYTYLSEPEVEEATSTKSLYDAMSCLQGPDGNYEDSFLTFRTESGIIKGVVTLFMTIAIIFCDQSNWQSLIAAKPREGIIGFLIAGFLWYAIPTPVSFVNSMTYQYLSYKNGTNLLTPEQIDEGYITPFIIEKLLGREGCFMLLTLMSMSLMSTGSGEVMSVSSILVYDIIKTYIKPFRKNLRPMDCPLCLHSKVPLTEDGEVPDIWKNLRPMDCPLCLHSKVPLTEDGEVPEIWCRCPSATQCKACMADLEQAATAGKFEFEIRYECRYHGKYRHYEHQLTKYKSWCMIFITISIVPFGLIIIESGMNLNWTFMAAQVFIAPFLVPLYMTIAWAGATGMGLVIGSLTGLVAAVTGMLAFATRYEGGLSDFYKNTAEDWSILTGLIAGTVVSTGVAIAVSLYTRYNPAMSVNIRMYILQMGANMAGPIESGETDPKALSTITGHSCDLNGTAGGTNGNDTRYSVSTASEEDCDNIEWLKTMSIDNPLHPYRDLYKEELESIHAGRVITSKHMEKIFRKTRVVTLTATAFSFIVFLVVIPAAALSVDVLTESQLGAWISVCQHWCLIATVFVVLVPPVQEGWQVFRQYRMNKADTETA